MEFRFIFTDIPADMITSLFAIAILLSDIFFAFYLKKIESRKWFIASIITSIITVLLLFFIVPILHADDDCSISSPCRAGKVCSLGGAIFPCFLAIDAICITLTAASVVIATIGLVKTKKLHCKIWPYIVSFLISFIMAILLILLIANIARSFH